ncbi:GAD-like domain-containing protein, partial [Xenorhabdus szentirmaii]|uniref:GAD-related domain-containing protein n=1 Tax=Xenorhabdus szentirmaii DSM 16338 TaxID=1427518 RepID=W1J421_9GAMM
MRDNDFGYFIDEFGEATQHIAVPNESIEKWRGKLPEKLLYYWKTEGWNSYKDGLFSIVNSDDYEGIVDMWLEDIPFEYMDSYHVIARSSFGNLYLCGEKTGTNLIVECLFNTIYYEKGNADHKNKQESDLDLAAFFSSKSLDSFDIEEGDDIWLFSK